MDTITKTPNLAVIFGLISISTSLVLIFSSVKWLNYIFAIFWFGTGILGVYQGFKSH